GVTTGPGSQPHHRNGGKPAWPGPNQPREGPSHAISFPEWRPRGTGIEEVQCGVPLGRCHADQPPQSLHQLAAIRQPTEQAGTIGNALTDHLIGPAAKSVGWRWLQGEAKPGSEQ